MKAWQLADLAECPNRPSDLLHLPEMGATNAVCLDFDFAIRSLKRWADRRSDETELVPDSAPERKQKMKAVPKYPTLLAVLGITDEPDQPQPDTAEVNDLVAAMLRNPMEWQGYGV
jgi:hypothetical protein